MALSKVSSLEGNEIADGYVRTHLPKGRWSDSWDLFKSNFVKFVIINVITLLFFVPGIAVVYFRNAYISQMGLIYPFSSNLGLYQYTYSTLGLAERITLSADFMFYSLLIVAAIFASIGLSGAAYSVRKLINTHGQFTVKDYFHGVRVCFFNTVFPAVIFMMFMFAALVISDWADAVVATGGSAGGPVTAKVFIIIATVIIGVICVWVFTVGVSYRVKLKYLLKNSMVLLIGTILQTIIMLAFSLIPIWLLLWGKSAQLIQIIAYLLFVFFGFSFMLLSWFAYAQWVFDSFITPAVKSEDEAARARMTPAQLAAEKEEKEKAVARELLAAGKSELIGKPIKPLGKDISITEVGAAFSRADIKRAAADRKRMNDEIESYYEEHKNDTRYAEYNKLFAEREKALQSPGKKGKKKKISADNLLK